jgi:chromosome condensin MukBEF complex kleisin-like MukF subunit
MGNNVLANEEQALGADQLLKVTALSYLNEALGAQRYEACRQIVDTAKALGVAAGDITATIADFLARQESPGGQKTTRFKLR